MFKPSFRISTKIRLCNLYRTSAEKNWPNSSCKTCLHFIFKIFNKPCAKSLNKNLALEPNHSFEIYNELLPIHSSSTTVTTSTSFELASSHAMVTSLKSTKIGVSQSSVSQLVTRVNITMIGLGSDKNQGAQPGFEPWTSCTRSRSHTTRPLSRECFT